ncbi:NUDIX hydrolase [Halodesulfurarchaeum sp.]|uniref:NUDIX hydrolase n=1 Tax=Halodesulfurarchaeum sp. TaxID=1980530 RepID=UPI002FC3DA4C
MELGSLADREPTLVANPARKAAVLVPLVEEDSASHIVFIRRSDTLEEHPGQMGFPGGRYEPRDGDRRETAVRESNEEIGLRAAEIAQIGRLDDVETVSGYTVSPFVARVPDRAYRPTDEEVADVVSLPLEAFTTPENHAYEGRMHPEYGTVPCHHFIVNGYTVWGATARMLVQLLTLGTEWTVPDPPDRPLGDRISD